MKDVLKQYFWIFSITAGLLTAALLLLPEKKNRLEIPPDFGILPEPNKNKDVVDQAEKIDEDIEKLFQSQKSTEKARSKDNSAEDFVLKQIKN
mgnify:CR=1 FL=1